MRHAPIEAPISSTLDTSLQPLPVQQLVERNQRESFRPAGRSGNARDIRWCDAGLADVFRSGCAGAKYQQRRGISTLGHIRSRSRYQSMPSTSAGVRSARPPGNTLWGRRPNRSNRSACPGDRVRRQPSGHACQCDPMAREALQVEHVRREAAEVGRAVHRDVDVSAPHVIQPHVRELREYSQHPCARRPSSVMLVDAGVAHAPAEQQPVVGRASEVVEHEVHVSHGHVLADQRKHALLAEWLGRNDVRSYRHHAPVRRGTEAIHVATARQHHVVGTHRATAR